MFKKDGGIGYIPCEIFWGINIFHTVQNTHLTSTQNVDEKIFN